MEAAISSVDVTGNLDITADNSSGYAQIGNGDALPGDTSINNATGNITLNVGGAIIPRCGQR